MVRAEGLHAPPLLQPPLRITRASLQRYALPLTAPLTLGPHPTSDPSHEPPAAWRTGLLLRVGMAAPGGREACGIGEVAPLPGAAPCRAQQVLICWLCGRSLCEGVGFEGRHAAWARSRRCQVRPLPVQHSILALDPCVHLMRGRQDPLALLEPGLTIGYSHCNAGAAVLLQGVHSAKFFRCCVRCCTISCALAAVLQADATARPGVNSSTSSAPGLHIESLAEAEAALRVLLHRLPGLDLPPTLPLLGGHVGTWLAGAAGLAPGAPRQALGRNPAKGLGQGGGGLPPSVRCGLEAALLSAVAAARGVPLASLLGGDRVLGYHEPAGLRGADEATGPGETARGAPAVAVNGLVACEGASACAAEAARLVAQGFTTLKIKVGTLHRGCPFALCSAPAHRTGSAGCEEPSLHVRVLRLSRWYVAVCVAPGSNEAEACVSCPDQAFLLLYECALADVPKKLYHRLVCLTLSPCACRSRGAATRCRMPRPWRRCARRWGPACACAPTPTAAGRCSRRSRLAAPRRPPI